MNLIPTHHCDNCSRLMGAEERLETFETGQPPVFSCPECYSPDIKRVFVSFDSSITFPEFVTQMDNITKASRIAALEKGFNEGRIMYNPPKEEMM